MWRCSRCASSNAASATACGACGGPATGGLARQPAFPSQQPQMPPSAMASARNATPAGSLRTVGSSGASTPVLRSLTPGAAAPGANRPSSVGAGAPPAATAVPSASMGGGLRVPAAGAAAAAPPLPFGAGLSSSTAAVRARGAGAPDSPQQPTLDGTALGTTTNGGGPPLLGDVSTNTIAATGGANATAATAEARFLRQVVQQAHTYGRDIEASIEHLSDLLRKKTVECEGLRSLAQENYDPLRRAVRREYEARMQMEARQAQEIRHYHRRVEELQSEKLALFQEVKSLRALVQELERTPPPSAYNENDNSLFNRVAYGSEGGGSPAGIAASWKAGQEGVSAPTATSQRDLITVLCSLQPEVADALASVGMFDFVKAALVRLCTRLQTGAYLDLSACVTQLLREHRADPTVLTRIAGAHVPLASTSDRQRVTQLFLANNPGQIQQLEALLAQYNGREAELFEALREHGGSHPALAKGGAAAPGAPLMAPGTHIVLNATAPGADPSVELHARIVLMYRKYNPAKLAGRDLNALLGKYPPEVLLTALIEKYGPEPTQAEKRELLRGMVE